MHAEAFQFISRYATDGPVTVLDIGGRNINGSALEHFPRADATVLDVAPGDGVHIVADAASWEPDRAYDIIVCAEVFEHTESVAAICATALAAAKRGGHFIVTCAGPGRLPHSGVDGGGVRPGEFYRNVEPGFLRKAMLVAGWVDVEVEHVGFDVRGHARKG